jgi:hypothetical protein
MKVNRNIHIRKALYALMAIGMALSTLGASLPPDVQPPSPEGTVPTSGTCLTREVTVTLG